VDETPASLWNLVWSDAPAVRGALVLLWTAALAGLAALHGPLVARLRDLRTLRSALTGIYADTVEDTRARRTAMGEAFRESTLAIEWDEFVRRWRETRDALPPSNAAAEDEPRAAVRLREVLEERPLVPPGPRAALLAVWPSLVFGLGLLVGVLGAHVAGGFSGALAGLAWGVALSLVLEVSTRLVRGGFEEETELIDRLAGTAYGALSPSELATRSALAQNATLEQLRQDMSRASRELAQTLDGGLRRIETSSAQAASLVSEEQKGSLRNVVEELRSSVRRAVESHVGSLQDALERAVEHQDAVSGGIARNYERMLENAESSQRVAGALESAAGAIDQATRSISETVGGLHPVLEQLRDTGRALEQTAGRIDDTQQIASGTVATVRDSLERAAGAVGEQRELVETGLSEIRRIVDHLSQGLGSQLADALQTVDEALARSVDRIRRTVEETNATVDRLGDPVRSAEDATRDMHAALDRVRIDVANMSQWLVGAVEPVRNTLSRIDEKSGSVARALDDVVRRAERIEKGLHGLGDGIGEQGGALRAGAADLSLRLQRTVDALGALEGRDARAVRSEPAPRAPASGWSPVGPGATESTPGDPGRDDSAPAEASSDASLGAGALSDNAISSLLGPSSSPRTRAVETLGDVAELAPARDADDGAEPAARDEEPAVDGRESDAGQEGPDGDGDDVDVDGPITYRHRFRDS
jgi:ABC-type transporter Mla subunit MlaD